MVMYTLSRAFHILFDLQIHQDKKKLSNVDLKYLLANFGNGTNLSIIGTKKNKCHFSHKFPRMSQFFEVICFV